jgi:RHS repeat-associated protein
MYTGQPYSSVTGLYYFGARYYDPTVGRFITEDSYEGDDSDPMTLNRYIYGRDNPERYTDSSGHMYVVSTGGGGAIAGNPTITISSAVTTTNWNAPHVLIRTTTSTQTVTLTSDTYTVAVTTTTTSMTTYINMNPVSKSSTTSTTTTTSSTSACMGSIGAVSLMVPEGFGALEAAEAAGVEIGGTLAAVGVLTVGVGLPLILLFVAYYVVTYNVQCPNYNPPPRWSSGER